MQREEWRKPELIVLVRSKPGEAVLMACKTTSLSDTPANGNIGCDGDPGCATCYDWATS